MAADIEPVGKALTPRRQDARTPSRGLNGCRVPILATWPLGDLAFRPRRVDVPADITAEGAEAGEIGAGLYGWAVVTARLGCGQHGSKGILPNQTQTDYNDTAHRTNSQHEHATQDHAGVPRRRPASPRRPASSHHTLTPCAYATACGWYDAIQYLIPKPRWPAWAVMPPAFTRVCPVSRGTTLKPEIRSPKSETSLKDQCPNAMQRYVLGSDLSLEICFGLRISGFGFLALHHRRKFGQAPIAHANAVHLTPRVRGVHLRSLSA